MSRGLRVALIIGGVVVAALLVLSFLPGMLWGWRGYGYGMMGSGFMGGYGLMFLMPILWIAVVGFIIWAVIAAVRRPGDSDHSAGQSDSALEILKKRYARGEISKEEFEARKKDLM